MPWNGRGDRETQRPADPGLKRPSNPSMVAKAPAPPVRPKPAQGKPPRASKKAAASKARPALPASVTMAADHVVRGEPLPPAMEMNGAFWGVVYRFVVTDANGRPIAPGAYKIRKHLLHVASSGSLARGVGTASQSGGPEEGGAAISIVALDEEGASFDFAGVPVVTEMPADEGETRAASGPRAPATDARPTSGLGPPAGAARAGSGKDESFEYFSFELQGVSYAIPQSGFVLARSLRGQRLMITRTPQAGGSIHGAVVQGFVTEGGGDSFSFEMGAG